MQKLLKKLAKLLGTSLRRCRRRVKLQAKQVWPRKILPDQILDKVNIGNLGISIAKRHL